MRRIIIAIIGFSYLNIGLAKDIDGEFVVFSVGTNSCTDYINARKIGGKVFQTYREWLSGYLSAFNLIVNNTYDIMGQRNYAQIIKWMDRYCKKNKQESFVNVAAMLTVKLYPGRSNLAPNKKTAEKWKNSGNLQSNTTPE